MNQRAHQNGGVWKSVGSGVSVSLSADNLDDIVTELFQPSENCNLNDRTVRRPVPTPDKRSFDAPDERRTPPNAEVSTVRFGDRAFMRITYAPGFRWTTDMKSVAGTDLCQISHLIYVVSGRCRVAMADGSELDLGPGDISPIPAGHDAWTLGDEPFVSLDLAGAIKPE